MKNTDGTYPLIDSQNMVRYMWKYSTHKQATQIPCAVALDEALDFRVLARAVNVEIERNDCMRLRLVKAGGEIRQYFVPEYKLDRIAVRTYRTDEDLRSSLDAAWHTSSSVHSSSCRAMRRASVSLTSVPPALP